MFAIRPKLFARRHVGPRFALEVMSVLLVPPHAGILHIYNVRNAAQASGG
jgi:hypothetical protein